MKINQFNKTNLKNIRNDVEAALAEVEEKYGIKFSQGSIRYSDNDFSMKLSVVIGESDLDANKIMWDKWCVKYGLENSDFGKTFRFRGAEFTVSGIKPKSYKYPVLATDVSGKTYKFPAEIIK